MDQRRQLRPHTRSNPTRHNLARSLVPFAIAHPEQYLMPLAQAVAARVRSNKHRTCAGSYVLADPQGRVFVIGEETTTCDRTVAEHADWLVGRYLTTEPMEIYEDIVQHLTDVGFLPSQLVIRRPPVCP